MSATINSAPAATPEPPVVHPPEPLHGEPPAGRSRKSLILIGVLVVVGVAGWLLLGRRGNVQQVEAAPLYRTVKVNAAPLDVTIRVTGQTSARNFANITAPRMMGPEANRQMVLLNLAKSGSWVKKGDVVAQIDAASLEDHIDDLEDTIAQADMDVKKREAEQALDWENLQQTLRVAKSELDKARLDAGALEVRTVLDQELLKLAVDESEARYKQLQNDLAHRRAAQQAELKILQITKDRHVRHRDRHKNDLQKFTVRAPMDGLVVMQSIFAGSDMRQIQEGDQVFPGLGFMKIVDTNSMQIEGTVNQSESNRFLLGQEARIGLDAFPGLFFEGKVASIGALAAGGFRGSVYIRNVPVRISIIGSDKRLIPDLSAHAEVRVGEGVSNAIVAPLAAIKTEGGSPFVMVRNGEGFDKRPVELGTKNNTHIAVVSGLRPGEEIRLN